MRRPMLMVAWALAVMAAGLCGLFAGSAMARIQPPEGAPPETTAVQVAAPGPPRYVFGSDGREHVDYDLVITNAFTAEVTLKSLTVTGPGGRLLELAGEALASHTHQIIAGEPSARIPASSTMVTLVDVVVPRSAGQTVPRRLSNRIEYTIPPGVLFREAIGSTTVHGPVLATTRRAPVLIASPVRGSGWVDANGCCADPTSRHRNAVLSANGTYVTPEMFDIDWTQIAHGSLFLGDGKQLSEWPGFGAPIFAVANGTVVSTITDRPEVLPFAPESGNPTVQTPKDFGGNEVIERIGPGLYAAYEHLQTGSVVVGRGQHLRTGEPIARLGNTGNTTAPHLHFGIHDGPDPLTSNSLPFEVDRFTLEGNVAPASTPTHIIIEGPAGPRRRAEPLVDSVCAFAG
ncbi:MAG: M23 family metallopeptidase [Solirubrobacteraceae bacterium]